ncbi:MAG: ribonuclease P protein component [Puniceicoccales bacterium]|jgi:ribonuclease P protein component|nr:ribonuclease P protein component [Puniceicoccales bacterium]
MGSSVEISFRLHRWQRICKTADFVAFRRVRLRHRDIGFSIATKYTSTVHGAARLAVITSRKTGNAVRRNALRRMVREIFRHEQGNFHIHSDWMVQFFPESKEISLQKLRQSLQLRWQMLADQWRHIGPPS